ncbi:MAG: hypothetical protein JNK21_12155, partial [Rhodospirillaceae bacterium]|nr:hypothetical protein [Rhodospirillaceae bacterium]
MTTQDFSALSHRACKILTLVAGVFLLASWTFSAWHAVHDRDERLRHHIKDIANLADVLREQTREKLRVYDQGLYGISRSIDTNQLSNPDPAVRAEIHRILQARAAATPGALQFFVVDEKGIVRHSSFALDPEPIDLSWRPELPPIMEGPEGTTILIPTLTG